MTRQTEIEQVGCFRIGSKVYVRTGRTIWEITGFNLPWPGADAVATATTGRKTSTFRLSEISLAVPDEADAAAVAAILHETGAGA